MTKGVNRLISGAIILTIAGIISKLLSAMYRIPLQNLTGDLGFYTYQQIYPVIATVMILSLYGFPVAVSRLTKDQIVNGKPIDQRFYVIPVFFILFTISVLMAIILFLFAPTLAQVMHDEQLTFSLQLSALLFLFIPFLSLFRGLFQAELQVEATAYSQIVEQLIRVTIIIIGAWLIFDGSLHVRSIAEVGVLASFISMLVASILLFGFFLHRYPFVKSTKNVHYKIEWKQFIKTIITFGLIASLNHLTLIFIQFVDTITLVPQLLKMGLNSLEAMEQKGIFDRGIPLIQIGVVLGSSFALLFVPSITEKKHQNELEGVRDAFSISVYLAVGATIGLIILFPEVNRLLYQNDLQTGVLQILAISIVLLSISIIGSAILQASQYVAYTIVSLTIAVAAKWLLNYSLVPLWGTYGSAIATVSSLFLLSILIVSGIYRKTQFSPLKYIRYGPLIVASSMMTLYLFVIKWFIQSDNFSRFMLLYYVMFLVLSGAFIYVLVLIRFSVFNERQLKALPISKLWLTLDRYVNKQR